MTDRTQDSFEFEAIFSCDYLLRARLRQSDFNASAGILEAVRTEEAQIRERWPKTQMIPRADSGFCPRRAEELS